MCRSRLVLRWRGCLVLWWGCLVLWWRRLVLLRWRSRLPLLWRSLVLLWLRCSLVWLHFGLMLLLWGFALLRNWPPLLRLWSCLALWLLLLSRLVLLLLFYGPVCSLQRWGSSHVAIGSEWLIDGDVRRAAVICSGELGAVGAGGALILHLCPHGRSVLLMHCRQFRGPGRRSNTTGSAVITHAGVAGVVSHRAAVDVVHHG